MLITCGYSFGDHHINDVILNGLEKTATSHVIGLFYDDFNADSSIVDLAKKQSGFPYMGKQKR